MKRFRMAQSSRSPTPHILKSDMATVCGVDASMWQRLPDWERKDLDGAACKNCIRIAVEKT